MGPHDELCPRTSTPAVSYCYCPLIAKVRADERERIAAVIEAAKDAWSYDWPGLAEAGAMVNAGTVKITYEECARIARSGGRDE